VVVGGVALAGRLLGGSPYASGVSCGFEVQGGVGICGWGSGFLGVAFAVGGWGVGGCVGGGVGFFVLRVCGGCALCGQISWG